MVGKWHVGCSQNDHTPSGRGFDKYYGFMCSGGMDYDYKTNGNYYDLWEDSTMQTSDVGSGTDRTSTLFADKLYEYITEATAPFFLYFASQDPHGPNMAPDNLRYSGTCATIVNADRQIYCGQIAALDLQVGSLWQALTDTEKLANTILFFASDNGGPPGSGAYNYPLRSGKGSLFDGGAKQVAFMYAGQNIYTRPTAGSAWSGLIHIVDMYSTFYRLAYYGTEAQGSSTAHQEEDSRDNQTMQSSSYAIDGIDIWDELAAGATSPRTEVPIWIGDGEGAIRMYSSDLNGDFKLILNGNNDGWYLPPDNSGASTEVDGTGCGSIYNAYDRSFDAQGGNGGGGDGCHFLFDMQADPYEQTNLLNAGSSSGYDYNTIAITLANRLSEISANMGDAPDSGDDDFSSTACEMYTARFGFWGPFMTWWWNCYPYCT